MVYDRANAGDIQQLTMLRLDYLSEDRGSLSEGVKKTIRRELPDYFKRNLDQSVFGYKARNGGEIVACAFLVIVEKLPSPAFITGKTGPVLNVYTKPEHRRMGHAQRLMKLLMEDAGEMGLSVVELKATEAGYGMYITLGFEESDSKHRAMRWMPERYRE